MEFYIRMQDALIDGNNRMATHLGEWGLLVARNPWRTILISLLAALACGAGFANFYSETQGDKLWIPQNTKIMENKDWVEDTFGLDFFFSRIVVDSKSIDKNVLRPELVDDLFRLDKEVRSIVSGDNCTFDTCLCEEETCYTLPNVLDFWCSYDHYKQQVMQSLNPQASLLEVLSLGILCGGGGASLLTMVGSPEYNSEGKVVSGVSLQVNYLTNAPYSWVHAFRDLALGYESTEMRVTFLWAGSLDEELEAVVSKDIFLVAVCFVTMFVVLSFIFLKKDLVKSRMVLAACGEISIILSIIMGYGLSCAFGVPFTTLSQMLPFIVVAIGVDDMLVLFHTLEKVKCQYPDISLEDKFQKTLEDAGVSITITSLTNMLAFILGVLTVIPAIQYFSVYAMFTIFADFMLQLSFFLGCMVLVESHAEKYGAIHCCGCCCPVKYTNKEPAANAEALESVQLDEGGNYPPPTFEKWNDYFTKPWWVVMPVPARVSVLVVTAVFAALSLAYVQDLKEGLPLRDLAADDSYVQDYYELYDSTFETQVSGEVLRIYLRGLDHSDPSTQLQMLEGFHFVLHNSDYASRTTSQGGMSPDNNWLLDLINYAIRNNHTTVPCTSVISPAEHCSEHYAPQVFIPKEEFYATLDAYIEYDPAVGNLLAREWLEGSDGEWYPNGTVLASTFKCNTRAFPETEWKDYYTDMIIETEDEVNKALFSDHDEEKVVVYSLNLVFAQQQLVLWDEAIQNLSLAGAGVLVLCTSTLVHPLMTLLMGLTIFLIDSFLFGLMYAANIRFNSVSVIILVMAIGLSVDYSMHVMHCFLTIEAETKSERAFVSLQKMGVPVMMGAATTLTGVLPLAFASSVIFRVFFAMLFATAGIASFVGLVVIPIVLSLVGPPAIYAVKSQKEMSTAET